MNLLAFWAALQAHPVLLAEIPGGLERAQTADEASHPDGRDDHGL